MITKLWLLLFVLILGTSIVYADDLTLSLNQTDYYFGVGQEAVIILESENTYDEIINGQLSYTITSQMNQGNFQYSNTNSQSIPFKIGENQDEIPIGFGTSDQPTELEVTLSFSYDVSEPRIVELSKFKIYFVQDESQKKNQENKQSSSSKEASNNQNQNNQNTNQQMEEMINRMKNDKQPTTQEKLQNHQLSQDSNALKQQMQNQIQEQKQMQEEFEKELNQNEEFLEEHQELLNDGYKPTDKNMNPDNANNTGNFQVNYTDELGNQASLTGQMENGTIDNIHKDSPQIRQEINEKLNQDDKFNKLEKDLNKQGFNRSSMQFRQDNNQTEVEVNYTDDKNQTAQITATIKNDTVSDVKLEKDEERNWYGLLILLAVIFGGLLYYLKNNNKKRDMENPYKKNGEIFDYKKESKILLEAAKKDFEDKKYKDAYAKAAKSLRLYLSYENNLKKEITNDEIIEFLKKHNMKYADVKECFDLCSLVEFAKYKANKKDFNRIVEICGRKIEK